MPEPGAAPGLVDVVQRWAARLANTDGVSLPSQRLEEVLTGVVHDALARTEASREAALRRFTALYAASPVGIARRASFQSHRRPATIGARDFRSQWLHSAPWRHQEL